MFEYVHKINTISAISTIRTIKLITKVRKSKVFLGITLKKCDFEVLQFTISCMEFCIGYGAIGLLCSNAYVSHRYY